MWKTHFMTRNDFIGRMVIYDHFPLVKFKENCNSNARQGLTEQKPIRKPIRNARVSFIINHALLYNQWKLRLLFGNCARKSVRNGLGHIVKLIPSAIMISLMTMAQNMTCRFNINLFTWNAVSNPSFRMRELTNKLSCNFPSSRRNVLDIFYWGNLNGTTFSIDITQTNHMNASQTQLKRSKQMWNVSKKNWNGTTHF